MGYPDWAIHPYLRGFPLADLLERLRTTLAGAYEVERELDRGGHATVYLARDLKHRRHVAIKVLDPEIATHLGPDRFLREIEIAARLQHPHILPLLDSGAGGDLLYYVMPYVPGESLRKHLSSLRQLPLDEAIRLTSEVARALDYAHRNKVVHRDIKPGNILLTDGQAVVADFGIAGAIGVAGGDTLTRTGVVLGTPAYMSPEQVSGHTNLDGRTDVYSLACVLYEMLAGQPPFTGAAESLSHQHLNVAPRSIRELRPSIPPGIDAALSRALAKTPADRFQTAVDFMKTLEAEHHADGSSERADTQATTAPLRAGRGKGRRLVLAVIAIGSVALAISVWQSRKHVPAAASGASERRWVWVADFDGPPDDPNLAATVGDLVADVLDQSVLLASVPREQVQIALRNSGRSDTTVVRGVLARELAFRSAVPVVIDGRVSRVGNGFSISLRATRSEDGHVIQAANATASGERQLIPSLVRTIRNVGQTLSDRPDVFRSAGAWADVPTQSYEAFKLYRLGRVKGAEGDYGPALTFFRQAIAIDPEFAAAWAGMGSMLWILGQEDSGAVAQREALRHPDRLTPVRRLDIEARLAQQSGDEDAALAAYAAIIDLNPAPPDRAMALNNSSIILWVRGRTDRALEMLREAIELMPVEPAQVYLGNYGSNLVAVRRIREAQDLLPRLRGRSATLLRLEIAMRERAWGVADSLARALEPENNYAGDIATACNASLRGWRGEMSSASRLLEERTNRTARRGDISRAGAYWIPSFCLSQIAQLDLPSDLPREIRMSPWGDLAEGVKVAWSGDVAATRKLRNPTGPRSHKRSREIEAHLAGWAAWSAGNWGRAIDELRPYCHGAAFEMASRAELFMRNPSRWILADAFAREGQPDSAAVYLKLILDPPPIEWVATVPWEPYARARLIKLQVQTHEIEAAREQWRVLAGTCVHPDPPVAKLLVETERILQSAEAMPGSGR